MSKPQDPPAPAADVLTMGDMEEALLRSGYLLETRLEAALRVAGYSVSANDAYPDPYTGKSRELDLHALRFQHTGGLPEDRVEVHLVIECVNNPYPIAFFMKQPQAKLTNA